jgi:predicted nucleic acid-binding protein
MIKLVVDASVAVKWFIRDPNEENDVASAVDILVGIGKNSIELIQPPHWIAEVTAVLARLQPDLSDDAIDLLDAMELPTRAESSVYKLASHLATELNHHLFDTLYHALALQDNAILITADHRYFRKSVNHGSICMLADFDVET